MMHLHFRARQHTQAHTIAPTTPHPLDSTMEDTTMLEASQGLFEEQSFTIIPNGISEDRLDQVCDASRLGRIGIDAFYSCANKLLASAAP
jgi:hypothetical protein